tara:strand:+ start:2298 stop:5573 length:3276 start_codon:yes stop_codon:yes gene_type:complete
MVACAVAMVVLRAGASRVFFDIVGTFQAGRMIDDAKSSATVLEAIYLDGITGIEEGIRELTDSFGALIDVVVPIAREIEEARIQFDKFLSEAERTPEVFGDIADIGLQFGFAADEAYEASARMAQLAGTLGAGTTPLGTEIGMMFGLISGMETEEAMQRLINLQQQTKFMTEGIRENATEQERITRMRENSIRVLDELNTVENRSAATMTQITYVMNQFASQAHLTGESIAAMAAMSATLIEAGEEQGKGGRALRMIYARLGADTNGARTAIEKLGITVIDAETGAMRPFSDILEELAAHYQTLQGAEQQQLAQAVAGNRHYTRLIKLLENVDRVRELENEALTGMFPAMEEIERRRETELFQLEQTEAQLRNYQAAFGDTMIDSVTEATEIQILFYDTLIKTSNFWEKSGGRLFDRIGISIGSFGTVMQMAVSPMTQLMMGLFNIGVAMKTLTAIETSMETATTKTTAAFKNEFDQVQENVHQFYLMSNALHELRKEATMGFLQATTQNIPQTREEVDALGRKIVILNEARMMTKLLLDKEKDLSKTRIHSQIITSKGIGPISQDLQLKQDILDATVKGTEAHRIALQNRNDVFIHNQEALRQERIELKKLEQALVDVVRQLAEDDPKWKEAVADLEEFREANNLTTFSILKMEDALKLQGDELLKAKNRYKLGDAALRRKKAEEDEAEIKRLAANAKMYNTFSVSLMTAGSAMMMFTKHEKVQRAGMILNGMAMAMQIWKAVALAYATIKSSLAITVETGAKEMNTMATNKGAIADEFGAFAKLQLYYASKLAASGIMSVGTAAMVVSGGSFVALGLIAYGLAGLFGDVKNAADEMVSAISNIEQVNDTLENLSLGQINNELREQEQIISDLEGATSQMAESQRAAAEARVKDLKVARDHLMLTKDGAGDTLEEYLRLKKEFDDSRTMLDKSNAKGKFSGKNIWGDWVDDPERDAWVKFKSQNKAFIEAIEGASVDSLDELSNYASRSLGVLEGDAKETQNIVTNTLSDATDTMYEFNNAREELFFGFSTSRVTGDLIRQVHQQGVETLIASTEVIMTNNFNGMTVPEVADQIIQEIESRGNMRGYSIS